MRAGISRKMLKSNKTAIKASAQNPLETDVLACPDFFTPFEGRASLLGEALRQTREENHSPPLRGSRRSRALAKADAVGGMILKLKAPPTGSLEGLRPYLADSPSRGECFRFLTGSDFQTRGGVIFCLSRHSCASFPGYGQTAWSGHSSHFGVGRQQVCPRRTSRAWYSLKRATSAGRCAVRLSCKAR